MRIVLLGAPGSGKGTQAQRLQAKYGVPQVSSGDLLRDAVARGTELGRKAKAIMETGALVSDDVVLGLIRDRLGRPDARAGFILDGYPRNIDQADALNALLKELGQPIDAVLLLDVGRDTLLKRLAGRRTCPKCGTVYNVHSLPQGTTTCAKDGTTLYQRPDDKEEVIANRLEVYEHNTRGPLTDYYSKAGLLRAVAGEGALDEVFERLEAAALAKPVPADKVKVTTRKTRAAAKSSSRARTSARRAAGANRKRTKVASRKRRSRKAAASRGTRRKTAKRAAAKRKTSRRAGRGKR
jgi:adenylate kinase